MLPDQAAAMSAMGAPYYSLFFYMEAASGPVRAWLGVGDYPLPADDVDTVGGTYLGIGLVGDIPALSQLVGGLAERVQFTLNGADEQTLSLADGSAEEVRNAPVHVGIVFFGTDWQAVDPVAWLWNGTADVPAVDRQASEEQITRRVSLSVGSAFTDRTRPQLSYYTDADQRRRSPTDTFCTRVSRYTVESTITWPAPT
ncbi:hypothetical protein [Brevundimonas subvibrioides]|uniref:Uncharacterized protein n=1 Tax=Brevundimonas subvibrioides (strain ATCC 15264 / DSM 4735 / LMG 14903 / NBRC 16000 / CB 81) TaxID=633149 RepID=D9QFZ0_BRESC|nr:hypothetical protein [Brevundimonas subvibrioides]ADL00704.1 conserved hypothetical protein [Brevundimonas subvibrioides ATCC 15264]